MSSALSLYLFCFFLSSLPVLSQDRWFTAEFQGALEFSLLLNCQFFHCNETRPMGPYPLIRKKWTCNHPTPWLGWYITIISHWYNILLLLMLHIKGNNLRSCATFHTSYVHGNSSLCARNSCCVLPCCTIHHWPLVFETVNISLRGTKLWMRIGKKSYKQNEVITHTWCQWFPNCGVGLTSVASQFQVVLKHLEQPYR